MNKLANRIVSFFRKVDTDKLILILIAVYFVFGTAVSLFSNGLPDEYLYLFETSTIANLLKEGKWIGADLTGTHGFLFKLPVAIFFIIFGKSLFIARLFNVYLTCLFIFALYKFGQKLLTTKYWSFLFVVLTCTSYQFVRSVPAYLREIPALLSLIILLNYLFENKKVNIVHGLLLLLLLDAKEYVAIIFGVSLLIYYLISWLKKNIKLTELIRSILLFATPSFLYIALMLTTNIIPYNDMMAKSLYLRRNSTLKTLLDVNTTNTNILRNQKQMETGLKLFNLDTSQNSKLFIFLNERLNNNYLWNVVSKFNSPRSFTVMSIPKIMILILLIGILRKEKTKNNNLLFLKYFSILYLFLYFTQSSIERFILPITPLLFYFFIKELSIIHCGYKKCRFKIMLVAGLILVAAGVLIFDQFLILPKILLNTFLILSLWFFSIERWEYNIRKLILAMGVMLYSSLLILMWLYGTVKYGTISQYVQYGRDYEYEKITQYAEVDNKYWTNGNTILLNFYRNNNVTPTTRQLKIKYRKLDIVNKYENQFFEYKPNNMFYDQSKKDGVETILYIKSLKEPLKFPHEQVIDTLIKKGVLKVEDEITLKNKELYILKPLYF